MKRRMAANKIYVKYTFRNRLTPYPETVTCNMLEINREKNMEQEFEVKMHEEECRARDIDMDDDDAALSFEVVGCDKN